jgi:hypothetical protein
MVISLRQVSRPGTSLKSLINGFILTKQTEGKSPRTIEFYAQNLKRFIWYANKQQWSDDIRELTEWHIRDKAGGGSALADRCHQYILTYYRI